MCATALAVVLAFGSGCSLKTIAVKTVANTLSEPGDTFTSDDDPELVRAALPFGLKLYETPVGFKYIGALMETGPENRTTPPRVRESKPPWRKVSAAKYPIPGSGFPSASSTGFPMPACPGMGISHMAFDDTDSAQT